MKINDLEFYLVRIERSDAPPACSLLACLTTDSGEQGWGEARVAWKASELAARREALLAVLAGRSVFDIEELLCLEVSAEPPLRGALEMASWDLIGRIVDQPLCHLFGGSYRQRIPLAVRLPQRLSHGADHLARELAEHGFHSQIVTATGDVDRDVQTLTDAVEGAGDRAEVCLDGDGRFQLESARQLCSRLADDQMAFFMDPLPAGDLAAVASLARQTNVPLAVSATVQSPGDVMAVARCGAARSVVVNSNQVGGLLATRKCAAVAEAAGLLVSLAEEGSVGVALAAMLQLAASTPSFSGANRCDYHQLHDDVLADPLEIVDGMIAVPQSPGLGVQVDRTKVDRYQVT